MSTTPLPDLVGRHHERVILDDLLTSVRTRGATVRVLRGESGVGKSALLGFLAAQASGLTVTRTQGVEADMELAYAGLQQLCTPFAAAIDDLPAPQRQALRVAFGLSVGEPPDRFLVGLAVLNLIARPAETRPVLVIVDDAQWLDRMSLLTLEFIARRLLAEPIAVVFAVRDPDGESTLLGLPELRVDGLDDDAAGELLDATIEGRLEDPVRDRLVAETRGNPLALLELYRGRRAAELAYGPEVVDPMPVASRIEKDFARRLNSLPAQTRLLLLIAAAEPIGDARLLMRAAEVLGITPDATPAKVAGLVDFGGSLRFRHPLARSAVYRTAEPEERLDVHRALASATDPVLEPDRRAWHTAQACHGPDEQAAAGLEQAADRARQRGGMAAEAVLLERATNLTPAPSERGRRALAAGEAYFAAASPDHATELTSLADICPLSPLDRARLTRLRARLLFARSRSDEAAPLLLEAAGQFAAETSHLTRETYLEAISATVFAGRVHGSAGAKAAATAALRPDLPGSPSEPADLLLEGVAATLAEGPERGFPALRRALGPFSNEVLDSREATMRWLLLAPVAQETFVHQLWDIRAWETLSARAESLARDVGALSVLPVALMYAAGSDLHHGDFAAAQGRVEEGLALSRSTGNAPLTYAALVLTAWRGDETEAITIFDDARERARQRGEVSLLGVSGYAGAVLYNGLARYDRAMAGAREGIDHDGFNFTGWSLTEHVEAAVRCGEYGQATDSLRRLTERTGAARTSWARGIQARCEALLSDGDEADRLFLTSLDHLGRDRIVVQVARTHLLYGEWLRRARRRAVARDHLRIAYQMFDGMHAKAFAERARRELAATGEHVQAQGPHPHSELTSQEAQIAALAAAGMTNPQIGAKLFLSPHTVEWHLRKVYTKLAIGSRRELPSVLPTTDTDRRHTRVRP